MGDDENKPSGGDQYWVKKQDSAFGGSTNKIMKILGFSIAMILIAGVAVLVMYLQSG